ncbi:alpha/beta fold hydrolase [Nocardiopsis flavescens]|uniref:alpha/beta fold hydrolase n=1 Tax=Nocardiopsis flavescens TaxID=758803 RepID=UPI0036539174
MTDVIATAADGAEVRGFDEGSGPPVLVLHPGMDDGTSWERVSARLATRFHVVRLHRRTYRPDLAADPRDSLARKAGDVAAAARSLGGRVLLVGHSSGAGRWKKPGRSAPRAPRGGWPRRSRGSPPPSTLCTDRGRPGSTRP